MDGQAGAKPGVVRHFLEHYLPSLDDHRGFVPNAAARQ